MMTTFRDALAAKESSNNQESLNGLGYMGLYQMGELALIDAGSLRDDEQEGDHA